ncbi:MAG: hypothetical protein AVDCRST_MAG67-2166, partial [uncultured Solirubrobacteraceae bacterium]
GSATCHDRHDGPRAAARRAHRGRRARRAVGGGQGRRLARPHRRGRHDQAEPQPGAVRAHDARRAQGGLRRRV